MVVWWASCPGNCDERGHGFVESDDPTIFQTSVDRSFFLDAMHGEREGRREGDREGRREGGREGGREGEREGRREGGREGERE